MSTAAQTHWHSRPPLPQTPARQTDYTATHPCDNRVSPADAARMSMHVCVYVMFAVRMCRMCRWWRTNAMGSVLDSINSTVSGCVFQYIFKHTHTYIYCTCGNRLYTASTQYVRDANVYRRTHTTQTICTRRYVSVGYRIDDNDDEQVIIARITPRVHISTRAIYDIDMPFMLCVCVSHMYNYYYYTQLFIDSG